MGKKIPQVKIRCAALEDRSYDMLIVEDSDDLRLIFAEQFSRWYKVITAKSVAEAEKIIQEAVEIRLLWTDLKLQEHAEKNDFRDGLDVVHLFQKTFPGRLVLMVTGSISDIRAQMVLQLRNAELVDKIQSPAEFQKLVRNKLSPNLGPF